MLHLYSRGCEYAIQALTHLSRRECRDGFSVRSVCRKAALPESFTRKIFQTLVKNGILAAKRGPGGGYRFKKDPDKISLLSMIHAIDGKRAFDKCVIKDIPCDRTERCSLHSKWMKTKDSLIKQLADSTIAQLIIEEGI